MSPKNTSEGLQIQTQNYLLAKQVSQVKNKRRKEEEILVKTPVSGKWVGFEATPGLSFWCFVGFMVGFVSSSSSCRW